MEMIVAHRREFVIDALPHDHGKYVSVWTAPLKLGYTGTRFLALELVRNAVSLNTGLKTIPSID